MGGQEELEEHRKRDRLRKLPLAKLRQLLWDHADERAWRRKRAAMAEQQDSPPVDMAKELERHEEIGSGPRAYDPDADTRPAHTPSLARAAEEREAEVCVRERFVSVCSVVLVRQFGVWDLELLIYDSL